MPRYTIKEIRSSRQLIFHGNTPCRKGHGGRNIEVLKIQFSKL